MINSHHVQAVFQAISPFDFVRGMGVWALLTYSRGARGCVCAKGTVTEGQNLGCHNTGWALNLSLSYAAIPMLGACTILAQGTPISKEC